MTNGGQAGTSGGWRETPRGRLLAAWTAIALLALLQGSVNALSVAEERAGLGHPVAPWEPWLWEGTSAAFWLAAAPAIFLAARRLRPPRLSAGATILVHFSLSAAVALAHVAFLMVSRKLVYWAAGAGYDYSIRAEFLYEYRKDLVTYALIAVFFLLFDRIARPAPPAPEQAAEPFRIEVRDGARTRWLAPEEIDWAQAAGNYAELFGRFGSLLHRTTLAALEDELAPYGFVRIHRSRLVRRAAVTAVETRPSGDFDAVLASGARVGGSRRYRERL